MLDTKISTDTALGRYIVSEERKNREAKEADRRAAEFAALAQNMPPGMTPDLQRDLVVGRPRWKDAVAVQRESDQDRRDKLREFLQPTLVPIPEAEFDPASKEFF